jgi:hypothetical protein
MNWTELAQYLFQWLDLLQVATEHRVQWNVLRSITFRYVPVFVTLTLCT